MKRRGLDWWYRKGWSAEYLSCKYVAPNHHPAELVDGLVHPAPRLEELALVELSVVVHGRQHHQRRQYKVLEGGATPGVRIVGAQHHKQALEKILQILLSIVNDKAIRANHWTGPEEINWNIPDECYCQILVFCGAVNGEGWGRINAWGK